MKATAKETATPVFIPIELTLEIESAEELGGLAKALIAIALDTPNKLAAAGTITEAERLVLGDVMLSIGEELQKFLPK